MTCAEVRPLLEALVDGDLAEGVAAAAREHLQGCSACAGEHRRAVAVPSRLRALRGPAVPPDLVGRVMRAVAPPPRLRLAAALLAAELVLMLAIGWRLSGPEGVAGLATVTWAELSASWNSGFATFPQPAADLFLVTAFLALVGVAGYQLALLSGLGPRRRA